MKKIVIITFLIFAHQVAVAGDGNWLISKCQHIFKSPNTMSGKEKYEVTQCVSYTSGILQMNLILEHLHNPNHQPLFCIKDKNVSPISAAQIAMRHVKENIKMQGQVYLSKYDASTIIVTALGIQYPCN